MKILAVLFILINLFRANHSLPTLQHYSPLDNVAQNKALRIRGCEQFSHYPCGRYGKLLCNYQGEVLAVGYDSPSSVVGAWEKSSPHRLILLGEFTKVGGFRTTSPWGFLWVVEFGRKC